MKHNVAEFIGTIQDGGVEILGLMDKMTGCGRLEIRAVTALKKGLLLKNIMRL